MKWSYFPKILLRTIVVRKLTEEKISKIKPIKERTMKKLDLTKPLEYVSNGKVFPAEIVFKSECDVIRPLLFVFKINDAPEGAGWCDIYGKLNINTSQYIRNVKDKQFNPELRVKFANGFGCSNPVFIKYIENDLYPYVFEFTCMGNRSIGTFSKNGFFHIDDENCANLINY